MTTILLIDDSATILLVLANLLKEAGYAAEAVPVKKSGAEGLLRAGQLRPDLILLDVNMPGMDGFEVCRRLKADPATADIPVIFMTTLSDSGHKVAGLEAGGVDYVTKPLDTAEVLARVRTHLALRAAGLRLEARNRELRAAYEELKDANRRLAETQGQLMQAEKMASLGVLAAGVAHEINNPVGFVKSNLGSLKNYTSQLLVVIATYAAADEALARAAPERLEAVRRVKEAVQLDFLEEDAMTLIEESKAGLLRVQRIVEDLKAFSHLGEGARQSANLHRGLDSTLAVIAGALADRVQVVKDYGQIPDIECVPLALNQAFMNLLLNAAQAISGPGEIRIRTGAGEGGVWVEIADTGSGIAPEHLPRIFDPFFTTKPVGQGKGLGLSLAYAAVREHHGRIHVCSQPGEGATFRVWLPLRQPPAGA